ncbi:MAG: biotin-independent malonate decarboxylase subunit gamma [Pseudomonadota bacterium]
MQWQTLAAALFPQGHAIGEQGDLLAGSAQVGGASVTVVGSANHAAIGVDLALAQAAAMLDTMRAHPGRAIVLLIDTQGQRLRHRDEMLGIHSYLAHLGKCVDLARRRGHRVIALVYDQALSGGFITSGLMADACYALPDATIRVMGLAAMARITKVPEARLRDLAQSNPVFAPGPENYWRMGALEAIWRDDLAGQLLQALGGPAGADTRAALAFARGGRQLAQAVIDAIVDPHVPSP